MQKALSRIGCCACLSLLLCGFAQAQTSLSIHHRITSADEERINRVLADRHSLEVINTPLREVIQLLRDLSQENIVLSQKKLEEAAVGLDTPVSATLRKLPLESILNIVLKEVELGFTVRDNVILVTTPDDINSPDSLETRVYPARDLVFDEEYGADCDPLIEMITSVVAPTTWDEVGGPGSIDYLEATDTLVVSQTWQNHRHIARLLETTRRARGSNGAGAISVSTVTPTRVGSRSAAPAPRRYHGGSAQSWQLPHLHAND